MINDVRNTVLNILNKDNNGYVTPEEFNKYAKQAQLTLFEQYFHDYSRAVLKRNNRQHQSGYGDIPKQTEEVIGSFYTSDSLPYSATTTKFILPSDAYWSKDVIYDGDVIVETVPASKALQMNLLLDASPSEEYPICVVFDNDNTIDPVPVNYQDSGKAIRVYPSSIISNVQCTYIRYPRDPKWTYSTLSGGEPVFDQSASDYQDFELPLDDMDNLVDLILLYAGTQIRDNAVASAANRNITTEKQLEQ